MWSCAAALPDVAGRCGRASRVGIRFPVDAEIVLKMHCTLRVLKEDSFGGKLATLSFKESALRLQPQDGPRRVDDLLRLFRAGFLNRNKVVNVIAREKVMRGRRERSFFHIKAEVMRSSMRPVPHALRSSHRSTLVESWPIHRKRPGASIPPRRRRGLTHTLFISRHPVNADFNLNPASVLPFPWELKVFFSLLSIHLH